MRPVVVTVGPLAGAKANGISLSQTPNAGTLLLNGSPTSGTNTNSFTGTAAISGSVMTVSATSTGAMSVGQRLSGQGVTGGTVVTAVGQAANTWIVSPSQTVSSTTIYGDALVTQDKPRSVRFTFAADETGHRFVITGTDWAGIPITETIAGTTAGTVDSVLSFNTISQITISANATGAMTVGTNGTARSPWVRLDNWADPNVVVQAVATGTINYTVQQTQDDPSSPTNPMNPSAVTWQNSTDLNLVTATATASGQYTYAPTFLSTLINSGTGSLVVTVSQTGVVPY